MISIDGVVDIETEAWDRFVLGGLMDAAGHYRSTRDQEELVDWLLLKGGTIWTWNGGLFDSLWLGERLRRRGLRFQCAMAGPRVTRLECEGLVVRDAIALIPMSLQKAARIAGIELSKETGLDCICASACGGYCAISRSMDDGSFRRLDLYLREDCRASLTVLSAIAAEAERCGYLLTGTVGGSSYKTCASIANLPSAEWPDAATYKLARLGYYGGRTEVFRPRALRGFAYDINSAYPAALTRVHLPTGVMLRCDGEKARRAYKRGKEGIYLARIDVPRGLHLPPLPVRTPGGRIVYPVGPFKGAWSGLELRSAESRGVRLQIDRALVWSDAEPVLAPALAHIWACRARAAKVEGNDALSAWHKWFGNSTTGKLAEAPEKERIIVNPHDHEVRLHGADCPRSKRQRARCYCAAWRPIDRDGTIWSAPFYRISQCAHVHFAAYLTAWARITLLDQLESDGQGGRSAVYCDTDSCYAITARTENIGEELGEWKFEGEFEDFEALAPKVYRYRTPEGKLVVRGKGLPGLDAAGFEAFKAGAPIVVDRGVRSFRQAAKGDSLFSRKRLERRSHADGTHFGGRILGPDGITHPQTLQEITAWEERSARSPRSEKNISTG